MDEPQNDYKIHTTSIGSELELENIKMQVSEAKYPQMYGIQKGGSIVTHPEVFSDSIFFGSADGFLYCLTLEGGEKWKFQTGDVVSCILVKGGCVYFGSFDNYFYCLDLSGNLLWKFNCKNSLGGMPVIYKNSIYAGSKEAVYSLTFDGKQNWSLDLPESRGSNITADENGIYFNCYDNHLYSVSHEGQLRWKLQLKEIPAAPTLYRGVIYCGDFENTFYAISTNGQILWKFNTESPIGGQSPSFPIVDDVAYFGNWNGDVLALDLNERKLIWRLKTGDIIFSKPAIDDRNAYIGSSNGNFYSIDRRTGNLLWKTNLGSPIITTACFSKGKLYFGTWHGKFVCLSENGQVEWAFQTSIKTPSPVNVEKKFELKRIVRESEIVPEKPLVSYLNSRKDLREIAAEYGMSSAHYVEKSSDYAGKSITLDLGADKLKKKYR